VSVDEAVAKVKGEVAFKLAAKEGKVGNQFNRRGAVKKFRGRLNLNLRLEKCGVNQSLVVDLEVARDLLTAKNNGCTSPFIKMFLSAGDKKRKKVKELKVQKTGVHEDTRNPIFKEGYCPQPLTPANPHTRAYTYASSHTRTHTRTHTRVVALQVQLGDTRKARQRENSSQHPRPGFGRAIEQSEVPWRHVLCDWRHPTDGGTNRWVVPAARRG
jgi:hypothetical protein